jgi:membrane protein
MKKKLSLAKGVRHLSWREIGQLIKTSFQEFFQEKSFLHGAALSYYTIFALVPLLYLAFATFGRVVGNVRMGEIIENLLKEQVGIQDVSGILAFLEGIDMEKGSVFLNTIGIFALLISSTALLASLRNSINEFFTIERAFRSQKHKILGHIIARLVSVSLLTVIGIVVIVIYFAQTVLLSFGSHLFAHRETINWFILALFEHGLSILSSTIIFTFIFKYLHDGMVEWKLAFGGAIFTSLLLYGGQLLIKYYLGNFFFAKDGGIAGSMLVILAWMYYSSQIIFFGAKFTAVYARMVGKPIVARK